MNNQLPTNEQIAQYLDNDVPLQQHDYDTIINIETDAPVKNFLDARLIFTKSKHNKRAKQKEVLYRKDRHLIYGGNKR